MTDFRWGTATAALQFEGAAAERGNSIWDVFASQPGRIANADSPAVACDHCHRFLEDLELMKSIGVNAYRFSVSWPRVLPDGVGMANPAGLDFYDRLVDGLLERQIEPWLTLYHWDLPQALHGRGGWESRESVDWFLEYTALLADRYGDRVKNWITINEPHCVAWFGYHRGWFAPGVKDARAAVNVAHHLLLAHGRAVKEIHRLVPDSRVGISLGITPCEPASAAEADVRATDLQEGYDFRWFLDPLYGRGYPREVIAKFGFEPPVLADDLEVIATPTDFLGVNFYTSSVIAADATDSFLGIKGVDRPGAQLTEMGWEINPGALTQLLQRLHAEYRTPALYVTENGSAWPDQIAEDGGVHDPNRVDYLQAHVAATLEARAAGVPVNGYFAWSLLDNFEWLEGYAKRFGLIHVDFATQRRTLKDSALAYRDLIKISETG